MGVHSQLKNQTATNQFKRSRRGRQPGWRLRSGIRRQPGSPDDFGDRMFGGRPGCMGQRNNCRGSCSSNGGRKSVTLSLCRILADKKARALGVDVPGSREVQCGHTVSWQ